MLLEKFNEQPGYNPNGLIDSLLVEMAAKNDAALARRLDIKPTILSKVRHYRAPVTAGLMLRMHEVSNISTAKLRRMLGVPPL